jgi:hypothetical protein
MNSTRLPPKTILPKTQGVTPAQPLPRKTAPARYVPGARTILLKPLRGLAVLQRKLASQCARHNATVPRQPAANHGRAGAIQAKFARSMPQSRGVIQRLVPLYKVYGFTGPEEMVNLNEQILEDLTTVQNLLSTGNFNISERYLSELNDNVDWFMQHFQHLSDPAIALDNALLEQEAKWMKGKGAMFTVPRGQPLTPTAFTTAVWNEEGRALHDIGARNVHGEFAHRIQWYIISRYHEDHPNSFTLGVWDIYEFLTTPEAVKNQGTPNERSLWDMVIDVQGRETREGGPYGDAHAYSDVGYAAPVNLTGALSSHQFPSFVGNKEDARGQFPGKLSTLTHLSAAVTTRRELRYEEERPKPKLL